MKPNSLLTLFIRLAIYSLLLFGILEAIEYDAAHGELGSRIKEDSWIEILQEAFLCIGGIVCYIVAWRVKKYRGLLISLASFMMVSFFREFNNYLNNHVHSAAWKILVLLILVPYFIYAFKHWKAILTDIKEAMSEYAFGVLITAVLIVFLFSRIYGLHGIWQDLLGEDYSRDIKDMSEEAVELLGYTFLMLGSLELCLTAWQKNKSLSEA